MTTKAKAKRPTTRKTGKSAPGVLRVDLLDRLFGLDGENVVRQEIDDAGKVRHVPIDLRYLVKFALDQKAPPGETITATLRVQRRGREEDGDREHDRRDRDRDRRDRRDDYDRRDRDRDRRDCR